MRDKTSAQLDMETAGQSQIVNPERISFQNVFAVGQLATPILKLNIDAYEGLFEWLSLADLRSLRQTCKRLQRAVDYYIKTNYPAVKIGFRVFLLYTKQHDLLNFDQLKNYKTCYYHYGYNN